jgi:hypothetical protein
MKKVLIASFSTAAVLAGLLVSERVAGAADTNSNHATYAWIIGATTPSDSATAPDGSVIELTGSGTINAGPDHSASGGGTYSLTAGGTTTSGSWTADGAQGFVSYGPAGPDFPPGFTGGQARLKVTLDTGATGVLTITCVLGTPPAGKGEGVTLVLGNGVSGEFTQSTEGNNVFILT